VPRWHGVARFVGGAAFFMLFLSAAALNFDEPHDFEPGEDTALTFDLPPDAPPTSLAGETPVFWELVVAMDLPGLDFAETCLVPIY
jgi:hypothetical protein